MQSIPKRKPIKRLNRSRMFKWVYYSLVPRPNRKRYVVAFGMRFVCIYFQLARPYFISGYESYNMTCIVKVDRYTYIIHIVLY